MLKLKIAGYGNFCNFNLNPVFFYSKNFLIRNHFLLSAFSCMLVG